MKKIKGNIITADKVFFGEIEYDHLIQKINIISDEVNPTENYIMAGFVDLHIHGGLNLDFMDEVQLKSDTFKQLLLELARHGTTHFLITTVTSKIDELLHLSNVYKNLLNQNFKGAQILGLHLEGPFINPEKLGAQPDQVQELNQEMLEKLKQIHQNIPVKIMTLAPEVLKDDNLLKELHKLGIVTQIGHTSATYEEATHALSLGCKSFTHLYNAMTGLHHRSPGAVGAALMHAEFSEIIPDLLHVHPAAIKLALKNIPKLYFVTDATSATFMPDGEYKLGTHQVSKCLGGVRLKDGTLAGSTLTLIQAVQNMFKQNLSLIDLSKRVSLYPCELIGEKNIGQIKIGLEASFLSLDSELQIKNVFIKGVVQ